MIIVLIGSFIRFIIVIIWMCWVVYVNMRPNLFVYVGIKLYLCGV